MNRSASSLRKSSSDCATQVTADSQVVLRVRNRTRTGNRDCELRLDGEEYRRAGMLLAIPSTERALVFFQSMGAVNRNAKQGVKCSENDNSIAVSTVGPFSLKPIPTIRSSVRATAGA
jgi:hypothetical protein